MTPLLLIEWSMAIFIAAIVVFIIGFSIKSLIEIFRDLKKGVH